MLCWRDKKIFSKRKKEKKKGRQMQTLKKKSYDKLTKKGDRWEKRRGKNILKTPNFPSRDVSSSCE